MNYVIAALVSAVVAFGAAWQVQEWRYGEAINEAKFEQSEAARRAFESAQREYQADIERKDKAIHEATLRAQKNQALARSLDSDVDRMRAQLAEASTRMPSESCEAVRNYAGTLSDVLGSCVKEYRDMAEKADGHLSDTIMLEEAWPKP